MPNRTCTCMRIRTGACKGTSFIIKMSVHINARLSPQHIIKSACACICMKPRTGRLSQFAHCPQKIGRRPAEIADCIRQRYGNEVFGRAICQLNALAPNRGIRERCLPNPAMVRNFEHLICYTKQEGT